MEKLTILVEGATDKAFLERLPGLQRQKIQLREGGGQEEAKKALASLAKLHSKVVICLDLDDKAPEGKFEEVESYLKERGISIGQSDPSIGVINTLASRILFIPFGLCQDPELESLGISRHSFEDYLIKIALGDPHLKPPEVKHSVRECLEQIVSGYARKGCSSLSSAQVYQLLKPFLGLPKHETGAISQLLKQADQDIVRQITNPVVEKLNSFLIGGTGS